MEEMFSRLAVFFQMPFVRYAFIVGILIALCASLLGVTLVLKRFSFIGDGLSHVAFGAMAVAAVVGLTNNMFIVMPITIISAVLLLRTGTNTRIKGDAAVAMISVGALAFGYLLMNKFPTSANVSGDVCTTLFGSQGRGRLVLRGAVARGCACVHLLLQQDFFRYLRRELRARNRYTGECL